MSLSLYKIIEIQDTTGKWNLVKFEQNYDKYNNGGDEKIEKYRFSYGLALRDEFHINGTTNTLCLPDDMSNELKEILKNGEDDYFSPNSKNLQLITMSYLDKLLNEKFNNWINSVKRNVDGFEFKIMNNKLDQILGREVFVTDEYIEKDYYQSLDYMLDEYLYDEYLSIKSEVDFIKNMVTLKTGNPWFDSDKIRIYYFMI